MSKLRSLSLMTVAIAGLASTSAFAQNDFYSRDKYEAVKDRAQPDFDAEPVRLGAFVVDSFLEASVTSTDNIFAANSGEESDLIAGLALDAKARSDWNTHEIGLRGRLGRSEYTDFSDESFNDINLGASGRLDVTRDFSLGADVSYLDTVQQRGAFGNAFLTEEPINFTRTGVELSANYRNDRVQWTNGLRLTESNFDDGILLADQSVVDQDFRDNQDLRFSSRLSYAISPNVAVFGQGSVHQTEFDQEQTFIDPLTSLPVLRSRDSEGYTVAGGVNFETTNLLRGDIAIGFFNEDKKDDAFADVDGLSVDGRLQWFPTRLTTVGFNAGRRVFDNGIPTSPSTLVTSYGAEVDHELLRNVILSGFISAAEEDFQEINRTDDLLTVGAELAYKLNKRVHLVGTLQHNKRDANGNFAVAAFDPSFDANQIGIALKIHP